MERFDFSELVVGAQRGGVVCLRSREQKQTRDGKPYLVVEVRNATGGCTARIWADDVPAWEGVQVGEALLIQARIKAGWKGGPPELEILTVEPLPESHPVRLELNPRSPVEREELERRFDELADSIKRYEARHLLDTVMEYVGRDPYFTAPAAMVHHHAYLSGVAEHSIEVAEISLAIAATKPYAGLIDRDMVIVGALLHDAGKLEEYQWAGVPISISRRGYLRSHVSRGAEMVALAVTGAHSLQAGTVRHDDVELVKHIIESHHGQKEWGSVVPPRTLEALVVHLADLASARLRAMADDLESAAPDDEHWVDPPRWRREPVWNFAAASAAEDGRERVKPYASASCLEPLPWEQAEGETAVYVLPKNGGDHA